jgi:hypothetical protein
MATRIVFAAGHGESALSVSVEEDSIRVFDAWTEAGGRPFPLTNSLNTTIQVWINPLTVAYWEDAPSGAAYIPE